MFRNYNDNIVKNCCEQIIYNDSTFVANSKEIAAYLFDIIKNNENGTYDLIIKNVTIIQG